MMDKDEKQRRCHHAPMRLAVDPEKDACRVYSRWVYDCDDCSFKEAMDL